MESTQLLDKGRWAPEAYKEIQELIRNNGVNSLNYDSSQVPYVVFDWDNTCIINDTEECLFIYLMDHLLFKLTPDEFSEMLNKNISNGLLSDEFKNNAGQLLSAEELICDILISYHFLYNHYEGLKGTETLEKTRATEFFKTFKTKFYFLYKAINATYGPEVCYPWLQSFFTNRSVKEVQDLAEASNDYHLGGKSGIVKLVSPETLPGKAGVVEITYISGLRVLPEISNLMNAFRSNGIDVFVVSASMEEVVEVFATNPKYGYNLPKENVYGSRLKKDNDIITPSYEENWPFTVHDGKNEVIRKEIAANRNGLEPIFVAGDSNIDYEMLTGFKELQLGLIINCGQSGDIKDFVHAYHRRLKKVSTAYVVQGRNENIGLWIPDEYTIKLGTSDKVFLTD